MNKCIDMLYNKFLEKNIIGNDEEYKMYKKAFADRFDEVIKDFDKPKKWEVESTLDMISDINYRYGELMFEYAFKLGANLMIEVLKNKID